MPTIDRRKKNLNWDIADDSGVTYAALRHGVFAALLMDIRDELRELNALLHCSNFVGIPRTLRGIQRKLPTPVRVKK